MSGSKIKTIEPLIERVSCGGTGLYSGMCEAKGEAVVCLSCKGAGGYREKIKLFHKRKHRRGIKSVRLSRGIFILTGVGGEGEPMTYCEFSKKFPEAK